MKKRTKRNIALLFTAVIAICFGVFFASCSASLNETESYPAEMPEEERQEEPVSASKEAFVWAMQGVLGYGAEAKLTIEAGSMQIEGALRVDLSKNLLAHLELDLNGLPVKFGIQAADGEKLVLAEISGEKFYFDLKDLPEVAYRISALTGEVPPVTDGAYPPVLIGGTDLGALLSVLDELNAYTILSLLVDAKVEGVPAEEGGYEYQFTLAELITVYIYVNGERNLQTLTLETAWSGTALKLSLTGIGYPERPLEAESVEGYKNLKNYLALAEAFCAEKVESVPALIETVKNLDLGKAGELIFAVLEKQSATMRLDLAFGEIAAEVNVVADFSDGIRILAETEIGETAIKIRYLDGALYLNAGELAIRCSAEDLGKLIGISGLGGTGANVFSLFGEAGLRVPEIGSVSAQGNVISLVLNGIEVNFDVAALSVQVIAGDFSAVLEEISAGGRVDGPEGEYTDASRILPLAEKIAAVIGGGKIAAEGSLTVGETELTIGEISLNMQPFAISGNVVVSGTELRAAYADNKLYLAGDIPKISLDGKALDKVTEAIAGGELPALTKTGIAELFKLVRRLSADADGVVLELDAKAFGGGSAKIRLSAAKEGFSAEIVIGTVRAKLDITAGDGVVDVPSGCADLSGFIAAADTEKITTLILSAIETGAVSAKITASMPGLSCDGEVVLAFREGFKAAAFVTLGGVETEVYYADGVLRLLKDGVARAATEEDLKALSGMFGAAKAIDLAALTVREEGGNLKIECGGADITIDGRTLCVQIGYGEIRAELQGIRAGGSVNIPEREYSEFSALTEIAESLFGIAGDLRFAVSGTFDVGGTAMSIENASVYSTGEGNDLTEDFESGKISIGGRLTVGEAHGIDVVFDGKTMYLCYNDAMKVRMSKGALDLLAKILKENFAFILDGFVRIDELSDMFGKADYGSLVAAIGSLRTYRDGNALPVAELEFGTATLSMKITLRKTAENVVAAEMGENRSLTLSELPEGSGAVVAPTDAESYMEISDVTYLADGFFKTANKNAFMMTGNITIDLDVIGIKASLQLALEANVRINKDREGRITGVDAYIVFDNTNVAKKGSAEVENTTVSAIHDLAMKYGRSVITLTGDGLYIDRMNLKKSWQTVSWLPLKAGYQFEETAYEHKMLAVKDCTGDTLKELIFYVLGVNASLADLFEFNATADYANSLAGYASEDVENGIPHTHEITLNLSSLLGSDMFAPTTARISTDRENLIVGLNVDELLIDFGAGTLRAELEAKNNVNNAFDATCFEEYRNHLYGSF